MELLRRNSGESAIHLNLERAWRYAQELPLDARTGQRHRPTPARPHKLSQRLYP